MNNFKKDERKIMWRISRDLQWENKPPKLKRSIAEYIFVNIISYKTIEFTRVILAQAARRGLKWAQNIFMLKNINSITIIITLEAIEKIQIEKNYNETVWTITSPLNENKQYINRSWLEITKSCHLTCQKL